MSVSQKVERTGAQQKYRQEEVHCIHSTVPQPKGPHPRADRKTAQNVMQTFASNKKDKVKNNGDEPNYQSWFQGIGEDRAPKLIILKVFTIPRPMAPEEIQAHLKGPSLDKELSPLDIPLYL